MDGIFGNEDSRLSVCLFFRSEATTMYVSITSVTLKNALYRILFVVLDSAFFFSSLNFFGNRYWFGCVFSSTNQLPLVAESEGLVSLSRFRLHLPSSSIL